MLITLKNTELLALKPDAPSEQEKEYPGTDMFPAMRTQLIKKLESLTNSVRAQKSQTEDSKNHFGFESIIPCDICTGALT